MLVQCSRSAMLYNTYLCSVKSGKLKVIQQVTLNDRALFGVDQEKAQKHFNY